MPNILPGRRIHDEAEARALLVQVHTSGQPLKTWCRGHDVNVGCLYWWRKKLHNAEIRRGRRRGAPEEIRIAEVSLARDAPETPPRPATRYELELPNRVLIRLDEHFDATALERLLSVAARC